MHARISALAVALVLAVAGWANAQVTTTGTIQVVVQDAQGGRLPGVTVTARAEDSVTTRTAVTNAEGVASLEALAPSNAYVVTTELQGFQTQTINAVLVRSGQTATIDLTLAVAGLTEAVTVSAAAPVVDVTNATTGQDVTLELTERLPTGRSYQSYLQLVPGVMPDDPIQSGNPAARSGVNYRNIRGETGISTDNVFYFDGINVTDPVTGTFGANLNTEIIQEQKVLTGGIPAEFVGAAGLISNVITKSGSNTLHGSANYFFQNSSLVAENEHGAGVGVLDQGQRLHVRRADHARPRLVLRQLPLQEPRGRRRHARHARVHAHGGQHAAPGLRQGHVGAEQQRPARPSPT